MTKLVGIDLGTTNSAIAVLDATGNPTIIANREGERVTPSAVFFEQGGEGRVVVGQTAKDNAHIYPNRVFQAFKRSMATNAPVMVDGKAVTPVELSSLVLRKLVQDASGEVGGIEGAVITVPANFTNEARQATMQAGKLAGLEVSHIVNEPTAALFYYSFHQSVSGTVLVYDFGGGTLDVTVAQVSGRDVEIVASKGDPRLGGIDFDGEIMDMISKAFKARTGQELDLTAHALGKTAEEYKKQLSARPQTTVQVTGRGIDREIFEIKREDFERETATLMAKSDLLVDSTLHEAKLKPADIANVFLVGGSTRMPMVARHLQALFGREPVCHVNPDEVVALGAALYAGVKANPADINPAQKSVVGGMKLQEVANHYFGTISVDGQSAGPPRLVNSIIIEKNAKLPCSRTETYYTVSEGQTEVTCRVTQSAARETDPEFVRLIWAGDLGPLPSGRRPGMQIDVTYSYDINQMMHCAFRDVASGVLKEVQIGIHVEEGGDSDGGNRFEVE